MVELPKKMKALVARAPKNYNIEEVDVPRAGEGEMGLRHALHGGSDGPRRP